MPLHLWQRGLFYVLHWGMRNTGRRRSDFLSYFFSSFRFDTRRRLHSTCPLEVLAVLGVPERKRKCARVFPIGPFLLGYEYLMADNPVINSTIIRRE